MKGFGILVLIILIAAIPAASAQDNSILTVFAKSSEGPVLGAAVSILDGHGNHLEFIGFTGKDGLSIPYPAGTYNIKIEKAGFVPTYIVAARVTGLSKKIAVSMDQSRHAKRLIGVSGLSYNKKSASF